MWNINAGRISRGIVKKDHKQRSYLFICHGKDCLKTGAKDLQRELEQEVKIISSKSRPQIIRTKCIDHCKDGPCVVVDNVWYGRVGSKDLRKLLDKKAVK